MRISYPNLSLSSSFKVMYVCSGILTSFTKVYKEETKRFHCIWSINSHIPVKYINPLLKKYLPLSVSQHVWSSLQHNYFILNLLSILLVSQSTVRPGWILALEIFLKRKLGKCLTWRWKPVQSKILNSKQLQDL